jgi:hypothetical protein
MHPGADQKWQVNYPTAGQDVNPMFITQKQTAKQKGTDQVETSA